MPTVAFPLRYRPQSGQVPPISPGVLTPLDDDTSPAFDPSMAQLDDNQQPSPLPPPQTPMPKPPRNNDTMAAASLAKLPPLNPDAGSKASFSGLKKVMPPPGQKPAAAPATPPIGQLDTQMAGAPPAPVPASASPDAQQQPDKEAAPSAADKLKALEASKPEMPSNNWAQRLGMAILAATRLAPAANQIMHPKWAAQRAAWEQEREDLGEQQKAEIASEQADALEEQRRAQAAYRKAQAEQQGKIHDERATAEQDRQYKQFVDSMGKDAIQIDKGDPIPPGYHATPDPRDPNKQWVRAAAFVQIPPELLPMFPGRKAGDQITTGEYRQALEDYRKQEFKKQEDANRPVTNEFEALLKKHGGDYGAAVAEAKANKIEIARESRPVGISLSDAAIEQNADRYNATGELPSLGIGQAGAVARQKILDRAAEKSGGASIAANKATYRADAGSLAALQRNRDAVIAFENTAGKNLDLFLKQAKGLIDAGSPIINQPLRTASRAIVGDENIAAFDAARRVALNEIAKVTSNPGLSGQLTDAARREIEGVSPQNATLAQIYRVAQVLKQDMANRHTAYDQQIGEIKGRLSPKAPHPDPVGIR